MQFQLVRHKIAYVRCPVDETELSIEATTTTALMGRCLTPNARAKCDALGRTDGTNWLFDVANSAS